MTKEGIIGVIAGVLLAVVVAVIIICSPKLESEAEEGVKVKIVDEYHRGMYVTPIKCGKSTIMQTHPARYEITVAYNGEEYTIDDEDTYEKYYDKIGQMVNATMLIRSYDDGSIKYKLIELQ